MVSIDVFVNHFSYNEHRKRLLRNFLNYRQIIHSDDYVTGVQYVDGSFVEDCETVRGNSPNDIDVFSLLEAPTKYENDMSLWQSNGLPFFVNNIVDNAKYKRDHSLDVYGQITQARDAFALAQDIAYWYGLFSHQKRSGRWKGFVAVDIDPSSEPAARAALGMT